MRDKYQALSWNATRPHISQKAIWGRLYIIRCRLLYIVVVIELVAEVLRSLSIVVVLEATGTTLTTVVATLATWTTLTTIATLTTWATLTLDIALGLVDEHTVRELVLTSLRINLEQFDLDLVTFLDASLLDRLETLPSDLRDVEQAFLARQNLYKATIRHDALHRTVVDLTDLRHSHDSLDLGQRSVDAVLVRSRNLHLAHTVGLVDGDGSARVFLHLLDDLSARGQ